MIKSVTTGGSSENILSHVILLTTGPRCEKTCFQGFRMSKTQTNVFQLQRLARLLKYLDEASLDNV